QRCAARRQRRRRSARQLDGRPSMQTVTAAEHAAEKIPPLPQRELALLVGTQAAFGFCGSMFLLLPKFLTTELHASPSQIGLLLAIPSFAGALAVPFVGR